MICRQCGKNIRARAQFCRYCGAPVEKKAAGARRTVELSRTPLPAEVEEESLILPIPDHPGETLTEMATTPSAVTSELPFVPETEIEEPVAPPLRGPWPSSGQEDGDTEPLGTPAPETGTGTTGIYLVPLLLIAVLAIFLFAYLTGR